MTQSQKKSFHKCLLLEKRQLKLQNPSVSLPIQSNLISEEKNRTAVRIAESP